jgi:DNA-binding CsgD family transcriptional regulator
VIFDPAAPRRNRSKSRITPTELFVALLAGLKLRDKEVAALRNTAVPTIKKQLRSAYAKLGIHSRLQLVSMFMETGRR